MVNNHFKKLIYHKIIRALNNIQMATYDFDITVKTTGLESIPIRRCDSYLAAHGNPLTSPRWSGTYNNYNLGTNAICTASLAITLSHTVNVLYGSCSVKGTFTLNGNKYNYELVNHSHHVHGHGFNKWGGNYHTLLTELAESVGADISDIEHGTYTGTMKSRGARVVQSAPKKKNPDPEPEPEPVPDDDTDSDSEMCLDLFG